MSTQPAPPLARFCCGPVERSFGCPSDSTQGEADQTSPERLVGRQVGLRRLSSHCVQGCLGAQACGAEDHHLQHRQGVLAQRSPTVPEKGGLLSPLRSAVTRRAVLLGRSGLTLPVPEPSASPLGRCGTVLALSRTQAILPSSPQQAIPGNHTATGTLKNLASTSPLPVHVRESPAIPPGRLMEPAAIGSPSQILVLGRK